MGLDVEGMVNLEWGVHVRGTMAGLVLVLVLIGCGSSDDAETTSGAPTTSARPSTTRPTTTADPSTTADPTTTAEPTTTVPPTTTAPPTSATAPPSSVPPISAPRDDRPAPLGAARTGTWWSPGADAYTSSQLWVFDPAGEAVPYGTRQDYQPAGSVIPAGARFSFTYTSTGEGVYALSYPSGTEQVLSITTYDAGADVLQVTWEGYVQRWYGCGSGQMPAVALAACR